MLRKFDLQSAINASKIAFQEGKFGIGKSDKIVGEVMDPVKMHDGNTFYGLYPVFPLPERCFSDDHVMYFTIKQMGHLRSVAIDINTYQVCLNGFKTFQLTNFAYKTRDLR